MLHELVALHVVEVLSETTTSASSLCCTVDRKVNVPVFVLPASCCTVPLKTERRTDHKTFNYDGAQTASKAMTTRRSEMCDVMIAHPASLRSSTMAIHNW